MSTIPSGYQKLAVVGIAYKGDYDSSVTYKKLNAVFYDGSTYVALIDSPVGTPTNDDVNWKFLSRGYTTQNLSALNSLDTEGILGTVGASVNAQTLVDKIAELLGTKQNTITPNSAFNKSFETSKNNIKMSGTASVGSSSNVARADHVHPSDTKKLNTNGDASSTTVTFSSADSTTNPNYTDVDAITSGETQSSLMAKMSRMAQNQRKLKSDIDERDIKTFYSISKFGFNSWTVITSWDILIDAMPNYSMFEFSFSATSRNQALANGLLPENDLYKLKIYKHTSRSYIELESAFSNWVAYDINDGASSSPRIVTWRRIANSNTVSDDWNNATTYEVGDFCVYMGTLWKCKEEHSNQEPSESTYWTETNIGSHVESLNTKMDLRVFSTISSLTSIGITIADEISSGSTGVDILKKIPKYCDVKLKATSGNRSQLKSLSLIPVISNGMLNILSNNNWVLMEFHPTSASFIGSVYRSVVDIGTTTPVITWYKYEGTLVE